MSHYDILLLVKKKVLMFIEAFRIEIGFLQVFNVLCAPIYCSTIRTLNVMNLWRDQREYSFSPLLLYR